MNRTHTAPHPRRRQRPALRTCVWTDAHTDRRTDLPLRDEKFRTSLPGGSGRRTKWCGDNGSARLHTAPSLLLRHRAAGAERNTSVPEGYTPAVTFPSLCSSTSGEERVRGGRERRGGCGAVPRRDETWLPHPSPLVQGWDSPHGVGARGRRRARGSHVASGRRKPRAVPSKSVPTVGLQREHRSQSPLRDGRARSPLLP